MRTCPSCGRQYEPPAQYCQVDGTSLRIDGPAEDPYLGTRVLDHFRIARVIGSGGMGVVYEAQDEALGRRVAIKILHRDLLSNKDIVARFHREAQIAHQLDHPGIVRVILFGQLPDQNLYLVLEYLEGPTLMEALERSGPFEVARAVKVIAQIGEAVGYTHARGIIHRDLKPENVILTQRDADGEFPKVLDFGIAKTLMSATSFVTQSGLIFGTARYISPEGASGDPVDQRSDVYSLAVMAYQLLTGHTPFEAEEPVQLLMKHLHEPAPPLSKWPAGGRVPEAVGDVIMRALAKNADARHPDAGAFGRALRAAFSADDPASISQPIVGSIVPTTAMTLTPLRNTPVPAERSNDAHTTLDRPSVFGDALRSAPPATSEGSGVSRVRTITRNSSMPTPPADHQALPNGAVVPPLSTLKPRVEIPVVSVPTITPTVAPPPSDRAAIYTDVSAVPRPPEGPVLVAPRRDPMDSDPPDPFGPEGFGVSGMGRPSSARTAILLVFVSMLFATGAIATAAYFLRWYPVQQREDRIAERMRHANDAYHLGRFVRSAEGNDVETLTDAVLADDPRNRRAIALRHSAAIQLQNQATALRNANAPERALALLTAAARVSRDPSITRDLEACRAEIERRRAPPAPAAPPRPVRPARRAPAPELIHPAQPAIPLGADAGQATAAPAPPSAPTPVTQAPPAPAPDRRSASRSRRNRERESILPTPLLPVEPEPPRAPPQPVEEPQETLGTF